MSSFNDGLNLEIGDREPPPNRWNVGDRVLAPWEPAWMYPGTIGEVKGDSLYIFFDNGDRGWLPAGGVRPIDLAEGSRLYCRRLRVDWDYSPATVQRRNGDQLLLRYDRGETEWAVLAMIRVPSGKFPEPAPQIESAFSRDPALALTPSGMDQDRDYAPESYQEDPALRKWRAGDRVLVPQGGWLYPGVVAEIQGEDLFVRFYEGRQGWFPAVQVRPLQIGVGSRVFCRWMGGTTYYSGTVKERRGDTIYIHYDDGDREWNVINMIRVPADSASAALGTLHTLFFGRWGCLLWLLVIGSIVFLVAVLRG